MDKIVWSNEYNIGIAEIDHQHKNFINIINRIIECKYEKDIERLKIILSELTRIINYHTRYEERLLEKEGYPDLDHHKREHAEETQAFSKMIDRVVNNKANAREKLISLLKSWFEHHLLVDDMAYQQFLIKKGVITLK